MLIPCPLSLHCTCQAKSQLWLNLTLCLLWGCTCKAECGWRKIALLIEFSQN